MRSESSSGHQIFQVKMIGFGKLSLISTYEWRATLFWRLSTMITHLDLLCRDEWGRESRIVVSAVVVLRSLLKLN